MCCSCIPVLRQQAFDDLFAIAEVRLPQPLDGILQIDRFPLGGKIQDPKGAGDGKPHSYSGSICSTLVDENQVGLELSPESDGGAFAGIELGSGWIVSANRMKHTQPTRGRSDPGLNGYGRRRVAKFARHFGRNGDGCKQAVKQIDMPDPDQGWCRR